MDLLVHPPADVDLFDMLCLEETLATILGREVDLVSIRGLDPILDSDILKDRVPL